MIIGILYKFFSPKIFYNKNKVTKYGSSNNVVFYKEFYEKEIKGREKYVCSLCNANALSILINDEFIFVHHAPVSNEKSIEREGLRSRAKVTHGKETELTLGEGVYCYSYDEVCKSGKSLKKESTCSFKVVYNGEYLKCMYGSPSGLGIEANREYLLLQDKIKAELIK